MNNKIFKLLKRISLAVFGLIIFGLGVFLQLQSNIGAAPWNALNQGIAQSLPISYGFACNFIGFSIIFLDIYLKEPIGLGMLLDAYLVGTTVDIAYSLELLPLQSSLALQVITLFTGIVLLCVGQWLYMAAGLGCGPRDALLIALSKRLPCFTVGTVNLFIFLAVLVVAYLLKATIGIGTILCVIFTGVILDFIFKVVKFDARAIHHESLRETFKSIF